MDNHMYSAFSKNIFYKVTKSFQVLTWFFIMYSFTLFTLLSSQFVAIIVALEALQTSAFTAVGSKEMFENLKHKFMFSVGI